MGDNIKIQIVGSLNTTLTLEDLNKKIKGLENKLSSIRLKVEIDDKISSTLNNFVKVANNLKATNDKLNSSFKENQIVIKNLDGSIEKMSSKIYDSGKRIEKTTTIIDHNKNAIESETKAVQNQIKTLEQLGKVQKEVVKTDKYGNQTSKNVSTSNNGTNTSYNYDKNNNLTGTTNTVNYAQQEKQIEAIRNSLTALYNQGKVNENFFNNFNKVINSASNVKEIEKVKSALDRVSQTSNNKAIQQKLTSDANTLLKTHSKTVDQLQLTKLIENLKNVKPYASNATNTLSQMSDQLRLLSNEAKEATRSSMGLMSSFETALVKYPVWLAATSIFIGIPRLVTSAIDTIVELDTKLVSLQKVMNEDTNFDSMMARATESAKEFGKTITDTLDSYTEFARQGFSETEIPLLADAALITSNVGEMEAGKAAEYLTSTLIQMKLEAKDAMSVIDQWNNISNNNATTVEKLAQGYARAGSVMKTWNLDMHEANAIIGTVTAATKQSGKLHCPLYQ